MKRLFLFLALVTLALSPVAASATTYYVAQSAGTFVGGTICNGHTAITSLTLGSTTLNPDDQVYFCGTITGSAGATLYSDTSYSGTSGHPITFTWDVGAILQAPYFSLSGGLIFNGVNYITLDGGTNGIIQNTQNGSSLTYQQPSNAILVTTATGVIVQHLNIINIYQHTLATDTPRLADLGIALYLCQSCKVTLNTIHDVDTAIEYGSDGVTTGTNNEISRNTISRMTWGFSIGNGPDSNLKIWGNDITCVVGAPCNWVDNSNNHHIDGMIVYPNSGNYTGLQIYNNYCHDLNPSTGCIFFDPNYVLSSTSAVTAASEIGNTVTLTVTSNPVAVGQVAHVVGITPSGYNDGGGGFKAIPPTNATTLTYYNPTSGLGAGSAFGTAAVRLYADLPGVLVFNNVFYTTPGQPGPTNGWITVGTQTSGALIYNNTVIGSAAVGIGMGTNGVGMTVENNIVTSVGYGVLVGYNSGDAQSPPYYQNPIVIDYNSYWNNVGDGGVTSMVVVESFGDNFYLYVLSSQGTPSFNGDYSSVFTTADPHSIVTNPNLNPDHTLPIGSPAIGAGKNLTSLGIAALDIGAPMTFGASYICGTGCVPRPATGPWDIGAYPAGSGGPPTVPTGILPLTLTINVPVVVVPPPKMIPVTIPGATVGIPYSQQISATGCGVLGVSLCTCSVSSGVLPPGLTLTPSCMLSGTIPAGSYAKGTTVSFSVTAQ